MRILTLTTLFPNSAQPLNAVFVRNRMETFARRFGHELTVVAPVPYAPRWTGIISERYRTIAEVPYQEQLWGYPVYHPRYLVTPKMGMRLYGTWMTIGVRRLVHELHARQRFDVIDGHYVYPDGSAAVELGRELRLPVILSARGTDLNLFPKFPRIRSIITRTLTDCEHLICVCTELKNVALELGVPPSKVSVIGNGVDVARFKPCQQAHARQRLGLSRETRIVLSVGHMTRRKGFDLLIGAAARLARGDLQLILAGDGPERSALEAFARERGIADSVIFGGAIANSDLPDWYAAADLFALASSREGWPNVVCEAQAMGVPVVATSVWGIPEIINSPSLGILVQERTEQAFAQAFAAALDANWDRDHIARVGMRRTWDFVADELQSIFASVTRACARGDRVQFQD